MAEGHLSEARRRAATLRAGAGDMSADDRARLERIEMDLEVLEIREKMRRRGCSLAELRRRGEISEAKYRQILQALDRRKGARGEERRTTGGPGGDYVPRR
jgi:hypothetical protein